VPSSVAASDNGVSVTEDTDDMYPSLEAFGEGGSPHTWETTKPGPEPEVEEPAAEGLSLRERLSRAAAARRRLS
jgi:hypothetical protein